MGIPCQTLVKQNRAVGFAATGLTPAASRGWGSGRVRGGKLEVPFERTSATESAVVAWGSCSVWC